MNVKTIYTVSKIEKGKVHIAINEEVTAMEEGDVKGNLVVDIETGIQDTVNLEMPINLGEQI
jgi:hypothetical protein